MDISKRPSESEFEYHKRLINGKLADKSLSDIDYAELSPVVYGKKYSSDVARRMMYGSYKTIKLMESEGIKSVSDSKIMSDMDNKIMLFRKEKQKFLDQRNALNKILRERAREEELNEIIIDSIKNGSLNKLEYQRVIIPESDNDLMVSLNDMHFGAVVDNHWRKYNSDICRDMLRKYLDRILDIADRHHSENCIVWCNGDIINGNIHYEISVTNKENVIEQVIGASELIAEFLTELSHKFKSVGYVSVAGNHSRINPNIKMSMPSERMDDLVEWYLKARMSEFENVHIGVGEKLDSTMYTVEVRGNKYCGVHGDFDGTNDKVQALQSMVGEKLHAVLCGHMHHNMIDTVQGVKVVMAGSFIGTDSYCVQKRIIGHPEQMVLVCDDSGISCFYNIPL